MASPQKENGFTAIANEIVEALVKVRIPASEKDVVLFVIRKTYGFQKKEDKISLTQFKIGTGLSRVTVVKALKNLLTRSMLLKRGSFFRFNKDHETWVVNAGLLVKSENIFGKGGYTKSGKGGYTYKRKKEMTKEISTQSVQEVSVLIKSFESVNPACSKFYGNTTQRSACQFLIDTYGFEKVKFIIENTLKKTNTMPYFPSITTPKQLQDKWSSLESAVMKHQMKKQVESSKNKVAF